MKFNVIIGNPPYQEMTGGGNKKPLYNVFVEKAIQVVTTYMSMSMSRRNIYFVPVQAFTKSWTEFPLRSSPSIWQVRPYIH